MLPDKTPLTLSAGRPGFGKQTRRAELDLAASSASSLPSKLHKTQTDGQRVKGDDEREGVGERDGRRRGKNAGESDGGKALGRGTD